MSITLPGGTALITGAASGIGRATAIAYARSGVQGISLADISLDGLRKVVRECEEVATNAIFRAIAVTTNVTREDEVKAMVEETMSTFGRIDYAANIAGIGEPGVKPSETPLEQFEQVYNVNARGVFLSMREEIKAMLKNKPQVKGGHPTRGAILNMGSLASKRGLPNSISYTASKHAVSGITKAAANSHGTDLIRINTLCPGFVQTSLISSLETLGPELVKTLTELRERSVMKRFALPEEIAYQVVWLNSPLNSYMTGTDVICDGGYTS